MKKIIVSAIVILAGFQGMAQHNNTQNSVDAESMRIREAYIQSRNTPKAVVKETGDKNMYLQPRTDAGKSMPKSQAPAPVKNDLDKRLETITQSGKGERR